jgi:hypothetical protein
MKVILRSKSSFFRVAQNIQYLMTVLGLDQNLAEAILPWLMSLDKVKRPYMIKKIRENIGLVTSSKNQIMETPEVLDKMFPFKSNPKKQFSQDVMRVSQDYNERVWVQSLIDSNRINPNEDLPKIRGLLLDFNRIGSDRKIEEFADDAELYDFVSSNKPDEGIRMPDGGWSMIASENVDGHSVKLVEILEEDAMEEIGKNTNWCVAHGSWRDYEPPFQCFVIDGEPRVLIHSSTSQIKDSSDRALANSDIKLIMGLVDKYIDNTHSGDFDDYDEGVETYQKVLKHIDNRESMSKMLDENVNLISYFPIGKVASYMKSVLKNISSLDFSKIDRDVANSIGEYIRYYDLPEKKYIDSYANLQAIEHPDKYLKMVPESFRTQSSNKVREIRAKNPSVARTIIDVITNMSDDDSMIDLACSFFESRYRDYYSSSPSFDFAISSAPEGMQKRLKDSIISGLSSYFMSHMVAFNDHVPDWMTRERPDEVESLRAKSAIYWINNAPAYVDEWQTYRSAMGTISDHGRRVEITKAALSNVNNSTHPMFLDKVIAIIPNDVKIDVSMEIESFKARMTQRHEDTNRRGKEQKRLRFLESLRDTAWVETVQDIFQDYPKGVEGSTEKEVEDALVEGWRKFLSDPSSDTKGTKIPEWIVQRLPELATRQAGHVGWYRKATL